MKFSIKTRGMEKGKKFPSCTLGISVGSPCFEGEKLLSMIDFINNNFEHCLVDVTDTLYRHNYLSDEMSISSAYNKALSKGDKWIKRNNDIISHLSVPYIVSRWDDWISHKDYSSIYERFKNCYESNQQFCDAVLDDINGFTSRVFKKNVWELSKNKLDNFVNYILEEISVHSIMYKEYPGAKIYPGDEMKCYQLVSDGLIADLPTGLQQRNYHHVKVAFSRTEKLKKAA